MWSKTVPTEPGFYWYRDIGYNNELTVSIVELDIDKDFRFIGDEEYYKEHRLACYEFYSERIKQPVETVATFDVTKYCAERDTAMRVATSQKKIMMEGVE